MKLLMLLFFLSSLGLSGAISKVLPPSPTINGTNGNFWRLDHFNKELFWEEPPEGKLIVPY